MLAELLNGSSDQDSQALQNNVEKMSEKVEGASFYQQLQKSSFGRSRNKFKGREHGWKLLCRARPSHRSPNTKRIIYDLLISLLFVVLKVPIMHLLCCHPLLGPSGAKQVALA